MRVKMEDNVKKAKALWVVLSFIVALSMVLAACAQEATPTMTAPTAPVPTATTPAPTATTPKPAATAPATAPTTPKPTATAPAPTQANWWDKFGTPQYGGTITYRLPQMAHNFDVSSFIGGEVDIYYETLFTKNWTLDRKIFGFTTSFTPDEYSAGLLAQTWEQPDAQTIIVHLHQGVHWQDKPPVNGRELTADDIVQHYDRILGTGSGYTNPNPNYGFLTGNWESVTATDKYTVVFKFKRPSGLAFNSIADTMQINAIEAPEYVKQGDLQNWKNAVGTGPWILTDFIDGTSLTYSKNSNYWGHDERYPQNQIPYADTLKMTLIPDMATALAALRTGKIDVIGGETGRLSWQQAKSLAKTNPELQQVKVLGVANGVGFRCDTKPFNDINVRKALQLAIDIPTIAKSYYGGMVDGIPCGIISPVFTGYCFAYEDWPQGLKDEYSYNPTKAKQLLAEAGYPNGFSTNIVAASERSDMELLQIIKAEFKDIGVDMEIRQMEFASWNAFISAGKHDQMVGLMSASTNPIQFTLSGFQSTNPSNYTFNNDTGYDEIFAKFMAATDPAEVKQWTREADKYAIEKHWSAVVCPTATFNVWQPYLKGYSGEALHFGQSHIWACLWIDQSLKE
jgi:peptide/nickel transport system substrate-binding protein